MNKEELLKMYERNVERINNADKWFKSHDPVDDESKEYKLLLELIRKANEMHYKLFVVGGDKNEIKSE